MHKLHIDNYLFKTENPENRNESVDVFMEYQHLSHHQSWMMTEALVKLWPSESVNQEADLQEAAISFSEARQHHFLIKVVHVYRELMSVHGSLGQIHLSKVGAISFKHQMGTYTT